MMISCHYYSFGKDCFVETTTDVGQQISLKHYQVATSKVATNHT